MCAAGACGLAGIILAAYCGSQACSTWSYRLGLPGSLLGSALAQLLIVVGAWLIWRSLHRTRAGG